MSDSESSALSSPPASDDEKLAPIFLLAKGKKTAKKPKKSSAPPPPPPSPPRPKRDPSPPHEETIADNPDIAFIVMFRSRFAAAFPPKLAPVGPQDIERGIVDTPPSAQVENLLCAILALALNRKKPIERGHHGRALEEAISSNKHQWPKSWNYINPLPGSKTFNDLDPVGRLNMLRTLIIWSMTTSEEISKTLKDSYKQTRHEDDLNQPLSVQAWGQDDDKRRYYLVEGQDDTSFRLYREGNRANKNIAWRSVAGSIDEIRAVAETLAEKHYSQASRRLASRINAAIPRFEATEEKRRRREYRQIRARQFTRPEPGFSLYEGRTRGKRMRYNYEDDDADDLDSDAFSTRRSTRNQSNGSTPVDTGPVVTSSGRTVRPRGGGMYGESLLSGQVTGAETGSYAGSEASDLPNGRAERAGRRSSGGAANSNGSRKRKFDAGGMSEESDAEESGNEWDGDDFEDEKDNGIDSADEDDMSVDEDDEDEILPSLVVKLKVVKNSSNGPVQPAIQPQDQVDAVLPTSTSAKPEPQASSNAIPDITGNGNIQSTDAHSQPLAASILSQPEPMDIDLPKAKLEHPLPIELPTNGIGQGNNNDGDKHGSVSYPKFNENDVPAPIAIHPPQAQVQANGWN